MKWHLFRYTCLPYGHRFMAPELPAADYGTLLMRGESTREERLLKALEDPVYSEVDELLADRTMAGSMKPLARSRVLQAVFGVACDPDAGGGRFQIGLRPCCPVCGSCEMADWEATEPPEFVEKSAPDVTHHEWQALSAAERTTRVVAAAKELGVGESDVTSA